MLGDIENYTAITFDGDFNVTRDRDKKHFYFNRYGHVAWAQTKKEASLNDVGWDDAVKAAVVIYGLIGVDASEATLHAELYTMGRQLSAPAPVRVTRPKTEATPPAGGGGSKKLLKPRVVVVKKRLNQAGDESVEQHQVGDESVERPKKRPRTEEPVETATVPQTPASTRPATDDDFDMFGNFF